MVYEALQILFCKALPERVRSIHRSLPRFYTVLRREYEPHDRGIGWIQRSFTVRRLPVVKRGVILFKRTLKRVMIRFISLNDDVSGAVRAPCSACDLCDQLERALGAAIVRKVQRCICRDYADQRDVRKIQTLCDHLRADEDVSFASAEGIQYVRVGVPACGRIHVHPEYTGCRKKLAHFFLDALRARAEKLDEATCGFGTGTRRTLPLAAVVADQHFSRLMICHRHIAAFALDDVTAGAAVDERGMPPPVDEQHSLLARVETIRKCPYQSAGKDSLVALGELAVMFTLGTALYFAFVNKNLSKQINK